MKFIGYLKRENLGGGGGGGGNLNPPLLFTLVLLDKLGGHPFKVFIKQLIWIHTGLKVIKLFFMLNSTEHEIYPSLLINFYIYYQDKYII